MNSVNIIGNLTRDPETRNTSTGKTVCSFSIAHNPNKDTAHFFECEAWDKTAETINQYLRKGYKVGITGRLQQDRWEDAEGAKRSRVKIVVNQIDFLNNRNQDQADPEAY